MDGSLTWTPVFSDGEEPNLAGAVYQALGAASLCWEDMSRAGRFQSEEATRIAEGLLAFIAEQQGEPCAHDMTVHDEKVRREVIAEVQELLSRQRILHNELIAPSNPTVPVLIQVSQVEELLTQMKGKP